jgi:hypothetical protein
LNKENKGNEVIDALFEEIGTFEKKKEAILRGVEKPGKKLNPKKIKSLMRRIKKAVNGLQNKVEAIEERASKL